MSWKWLTNKGMKGFLSPKFGMAMAIITFAAKAGKFDPAVSLARTLLRPLGISDIHISRTVISLADMGDGSHSSLLAHFLRLQREKLCSTPKPPARRVMATESPQVKAIFAALEELENRHAVTDTLAR